jgi:hypothetical protein
LTNTQPTGGFVKHSGKALLPSSKAACINSSDSIDMRINYAGNDVQDLDQSA